MTLSKPLSAAAALVLLLALAGCTSAAPSTGGGGDAGDATPAASASAGTDAGTDTDTDADAGGGLCAVVPSAELSAAVGTDAGTGAPGNENGLDNCTWTVDGGPAVLAQSADAVTYFPTDLYPKPDGATDIAGVDTGWASAEQRTVFIVKGGTGFMLNDFLFTVETGDQDAWAALGAAIAANL